VGANAKRPTSSAPGSGGSGFYQNALNQQKQAVAGSSAMSAARGRSGASEGAPVEGKPTPVPAEDTRYLDAYNRYMQERSGGSQYPVTQGSPFDQSQPPVNKRQPRPPVQEQAPASPNGITMGAGYANRSFS